MRELSKNQYRQKLIGIHLNEINFDYLEAYAQRGYLPHFKRLFARYGYSRTLSETKHELANPWIQWPTVHTGLDFADHGVFRTGDIVKTDHPHIYEVLENHGVSVAAMSPFNAKNNTRNAAFFVPDPWTLTRFDGSWTLRLLYEALVQVANDYAERDISTKSLLSIALNLAAHAPLSAYPAYLREATRYFSGKIWYRALICDRLLVDVFLKQWQKHRPDFSTLFINGGAHLQHHYLYSSLIYDGDKRNPEWHVAPGEDPLLDIFQVYDEMIGRLLALGEDVRLMVITALHQMPHERTTYYYRIDDQPALLQRLGIDYTQTYPLMTEDFVVCFADEQKARQAEQQLLDVKTVNGPEIFYRETGDSPVRTLNVAANIFHIENRGSDLYVQLKPTSQATYKNMTVQSGTVTIEQFETLVSFAQYKNTHHQGDGYFLDTGVEKGTWPADIQLRDIFQMILDVYGIGSATRTPALSSVS